MSGWTAGMVDVAKDFGAATDGQTVVTGDVQAAIDACASRGGGTVYVPPGRFVSGALRLRANVTLYLEAGAVLVAAPRRDDYDSPHLIFAEDSPNVSIRGRGEIDGNYRAFCRPGELRGVRCWKRAGWTPAPLLRFVRCDNLLLEDFTIRDAPGWSIHPVDCVGVLIRGLTILNGVTEEDHVVNSDGINPDGCSAVRISDCYLQCGDDCICLKVMQRPGGRKVCRDITVTNCVMLSTSTALTLGTETYGEFRDIAVSNCAILDSRCGIKVQATEGGLIDGLSVSNVTMSLGPAGHPIAFWGAALNPCNSEPRDGAWPVIRNVSISHVLAEGDGALTITLPPEAPGEKITIESARFHVLGIVPREYHADPPREFPPYSHHKSMHDIYCRGVRNLALRHVELTWGSPEKPEFGSALRCRDVHGLEIDAFHARQALGSSAAAICLQDVSDAFVHACRAPRGTGTFLRLGPGVRNISLIGNDLHFAERVFEAVARADAGELFQTGNRPPSGERVPPPNV